MRDCAVELCEPDEVPEPWVAPLTPAEAPAAAVGGHAAGDRGNQEADEAKNASETCAEQAAEAGSLWNVERAAGDAMAVDRWTEGLSEDVWIVQDEDDDEGMVYVDLLDNPERCLSSRPLHGLLSPLDRLGFCNSSFLRQALCHCRFTSRCPIFLFARKVHRLLWRERKARVEGHPRRELL